MQERSSSRVAALAFLAFGFLMVGYGPRSTLHGAEPDPAPPRASRGAIEMVLDKGGRKITTLTNLLTHGEWLEVPSPAYRMEVDQRITTRLGIRRCRAERPNLPSRWSTSCRCLCRVRPTSPLLEGLSPGQDAAGELA